MRGKKPERPLSAGGLWVLAGLALGSAALGFWIAQSVNQVERDRRDLLWAEMLASQASAIEDSLNENVASIRRQLELLRSAPAGSLPPQGGLVHWAEVEWLNQLPSVRRAGVNPEYAGQFAEPAQRSYLASALRKLGSRGSSGDPQAARSQSAQSFESYRFRKDPLQSIEWLAMTFPVPANSGRVLLALVDPVRTFTAFQASGNAVGVSRKYLLARDGRVLTHSHPPYVGADFGATEVFSKISKIQAAAGASGAASRGFVSEAKALDLRRVAAAYWTVEGMPCIGVVERLSSGAGVSAPFRWRQLAGAALITLGGLATLIGIAGWLMIGFPMGFSDKIVGKGSRK